MTHMLKKVSWAVVYLFLLPFVLHAQGGGGGTGGGSTDDIGIEPFGPSDLEVVIQTILTKLIQFGTLLLAVMIVWTGFLFVTAGGSEDKLKTAKASLLWTIVGGAIILGALGISELVFDTVGGL